MRRSILASLMLVLCFILSSVGSHAAALGQPIVSFSRDSSKRLFTSLSAPGAPAPGGTVELTFEVQLLEPVAAMTIEWIAPSGVEIIGAANEVVKDKPAGATVRSTRNVRFPSAGVFRVDAVASFEPNSAAHFSTGEALFFSIGTGGSSVSVADPLASPPARSNRPTRVKDISTLQAPEESLTSSSGDPCFSVSGTLRRLDKAPTLTGYTDVPNAPVRYALVELRDWDEVDDESYGFAVTNSNGYFRFPSFCDDDGWGDDELELFIRVHAEVRDPEHTGFRVAYVEDSSWIDEEYEFDRPYVKSTGGSVTLDWTLDNTASGIMNITEAAYNAWKFWNVSGGVWGGAAYFNHTAEIHWEYNYPESSGSHYYGWTFDEITINGEAADQDQWDETVVMHEWNHFADDKYGCDDSPGGPHNIGAYLEDPEFSMSEGYGDFYPSAVRRWLGDPLAHYYLNGDPTGVHSWYVDLDAYPNPGGDWEYPRHRTFHDEMAVAATFWDLIDTVPDLQDQAALPFSVIQQGFTNPRYVNNGTFDDTCDLPTYFQKWNEAGLPSTREVAAAIYQNVGFVPWSGPSTEGIQERPVNWWYRTVFVLDNSSSMSGDKFTAAKSAINDAANQLGANPRGAEFSLNLFNNNNPEGQNIFTGLFFPADVATQVNSLAIAPDTDTCQVDSYRAAMNTAVNRVDGNIWLITDRGPVGDSRYTYDFSNRLIRQRMKANIAFLGGCTAPDADCSISLAAEQQPSEQVRSALAETLGPVTIKNINDEMANYMIAAQRTGGQFMYIPSSDLPNAAQIMSTVINHTTGSGRWSDYVSLNSTYTWEKLATYEYHWIDAKAAGTNHGTPVGEGYINIPIPSPYFQNAYRWDTRYADVRAYENGYLTFGPHGAEVSANINLPNAAEPNLALYPFWDDLVGNEPDLLDGRIFSVLSGDWFVIEYADFWNSAINQNITFEVLLNLVTGEVRFQYQQVDFGSGSATIGAENETGTAAVVISYNDTKGASAGMGYKLIPAPAVPSRTYTVTVNPGAQNAGFLLSGFSGSFAALEVRFPSGGLIPCTPGVCTTAGLTQLVYGGSPPAGNYQVTVRPGATGEGTYSFTAFTDGGVRLHSGSSHINTTLLLAPMSITLDRPVDTNQVLAQFFRPNGSAFGSVFHLYDDGLHSDGQAGDGRFASTEFLPPAAGTVYLHLQATIGGVLHTFTEDTPYTFQPVDVDSQGDGENFGGSTQLDFRIYNDDTVEHCYDLDATLPEGWHVTLPYDYVCLSAYSNSLASLTVYMAEGTTNTLPSGTSGKVTLTVVEQEKGIMIGSDQAKVTRRRPPALVTIENLINYLAPNGAHSDLIIQVRDAEGWPVEDGLTVNLSTTLGELPTSAPLVRGRAVVTFTTNDKTGTALITATAGSASAQTEILVKDWELHNAVLTADPASILGNGVTTSTIRLIVTNAAKQPVKNQSVRLRLSGDDTSLGTLNGGLEVTGMTDDLGQINATYQSAPHFGKVVITAEVLNGVDILLTSQVEVTLQGIQRFLPLISR